MNYWPKQQTFVDFWKTAKHRNCLKKCAICNKNWTELNSTYVHFMYSADGKEKYFCDDCEENLTE